MSLDFLDPRPRNEYQRQLTPDLVPRRHAGRPVLPGLSRALPGDSGKVPRRRHEAPNRAVDDVVDGHRTTPRMPLCRDEGLPENAGKAAPRKRYWSRAFSEMAQRSPGVVGAFSQHGLESNACRAMASSHRRGFGDHAFRLRMTGGKFSCTSHNPQARSEHV